MSDKDLIYRGKAKQKIRETLLEDDESYGDALWAIDECPAVPHEMTARELLLTEGRMIQEDSDAYREYAPLAWNRKVDEAVAFAEKWAREHPEENDE